MKKISLHLFRIINAVVLCMTANLHLIHLLHMPFYSILMVFSIVCYILINIFPSVPNRKLETFQLRMCGDGSELLILFLLSTIGSTIVDIVALSHIEDIGLEAWLINLVLVFLLEAIVFWNGIIRVYCTSTQLALKWRVIGIISGFLPIIHLIILGKIITITYQEATFESDKLLCNKDRSISEICHTKYPLLMVHGVFFRDFKYFNYWGRVPAELEANGAKIYYGNHQSAASVADSGNELADSIKQILSETGCEKVNIIAHSKGGLDCRYAITHCNMAPYVASLTSINTPHRGCGFATYLLSKIPKSTQNFVAETYNAALRKVGDPNPDFLAAVFDLTDVSCEKFNEETPDMPGILYQSVGSRLNHATNGRFPLNFSQPLVKYFDGPNDGLVSASSFPWGSNYTFLTVPGKRGISHGDMIDLNRENIPQFDVRQFYVNLVADLKRKAY